MRRVLSSASCSFFKLITQRSKSVLLARRNSLRIFSSAGSTRRFFIWIRHTSPVRLTMPMSCPGVPSTATTSPSVTSRPSGRRKKSLRLFLKRTSTQSKGLRPGWRMPRIQLHEVTLLQLRVSVSLTGTYDSGQRLHPRERNTLSSYFTQGNVGSGSRYGSIEFSGAKCSPKMSTSSSGEPSVVLIRPEVECPLSLAAVRRRSLMNASTSSAVAASSSTFFTSVCSPLIISGDTLSLALPFIISGDTPAVCLFSSIKVYIQSKNLFNKTISTV